MRWVRYALAVLATVISGGAAALAFAVASLPASPCEVEADRYESLRLEIPRAEAARHLGCDGVLAGATEFTQELRREIVRWRGACWPYHRISLTLYNGIVHEKSQVNLCLSLGWPSAGRG